MTVFGIALVVGLALLVGALLAVFDHRRSAARDAIRERETLNLDWWEREL